MVTSIAPIIQQYTPRGHARVGDRSAYVTLEPDAYLDSTTSATQLATPTNQLSAIDYANAPDQSFTYDLNGNRTGSGNVTGADNRLTSNATWDFVYDANGNMTRRTLKSDNSYIEYTYDHRDRLTDVRYRNSAGTLTKRVHFGYDALNRRYLQTVENGSGTILSTVYYVNQGFRKDRGDAGDEIALRLDGTGAVISRYLHGSMVDEVLAEENIGSGGVRDILWAMTDHQGSVRDLARVTSGTASVVNHIVYDAFGKTVSETDAAIAHLYGYTGRELDKETGLQYNRARYLDLVLARWISQDPKSFDAGDTNLYRYVGNHPSYATDPSGLFKVGDGHHIIPQELWKSFDTTITDVWDTVTARIRDDYYNFHDGVTINGVPHAQYNAAVASELEKFAKGKSMNPELAQKFLDEIKGSENKIIKAFNDGVRQEVALAAQIGEAEYRKRMSKFTPKTQAYSEARDTAFEAARAAAELEVKKRRGTAAAELSKIANRLSKLDGVIGYAKRGLGYVARHTPILVGGYVYYTTGDVNQALAESTPLCWSLEGGRAIGSFYEYAQDEIEETAFETRYSERWYMGSAHSRQGAYDHAKAARDAAKGR